MTKFKSKKKRHIHFKIIIFIIFFITGFFSVFSYFISPTFFFNYLKERYFPDDSSFVSWYLKNTFGENVVDEDTGLGKTKYIPDPNPTSNNKEPILYLYNSHQTEEYNADLLMEHDIVPSVMTASYILREQLNNLGINTMVETTDLKKTLEEHNWDYTASYKASRLLLENAQAKYPTLKYFIDIHRDSISYQNSTINTASFTGAKVLFVIGTEHKDYEKNKEFATKISEALNQTVSGISRGILEKGGAGNNGIYNQDFNSNTILIEVGSSYNSIAQVNATMKILAECLKKVIGG